jgi:alkylation response protein AidB-like acyl-CoA dehydrogenase
MTLAAKKLPSESGMIGAGEYLDRICSVLPALRARSEQCDALRRAPDETIRDFTELGLLKVCQPARCGGFELSWDVLCSAAQMTAEACGSQAWIFKNLADHAQMLGTFPAQAQDDVWKESSDIFIAAGIDPVGKAKRVRGGFEYSGRHSFSSGIDHVSWVIAGGYIVDERDRGPFFFLLPKSDVVVIDDWHAMGLAGTGSKSFEVNGAFVPDHRTLSGFLSVQGKGPGTEVNKAAVYRIPRGSGITTAGFASQCIGLAMSVRDEWIKYTIPRKSRGVAVAAQQTSQALLARAAADIEAADLICKTSLKIGLDLVATNQLPSNLQIASSKRNMAYAAQRSLDAATSLFNAAGGRVLMLDNHMQRQYRNLIAAASHHGLAWDKAAVEFGSLMLAPTDQI